MKSLDLPKFQKLHALATAGATEGERSAARGRATSLAKAAGLTFEQATARMKSVQPVQQMVNIFAGFDDFMEEREPGYKARNAAEKAEKARLRALRRAALLQRYGSKEAIEAPCEREQLIHAALGPLRIAQKPPHQRWTADLVGWDNHINPVPTPVREAAALAYPLPVTFAAALAEYEYWEQRNRDLEDLYDDPIGDEQIDMATCVRRDIVRDLIERELPIRTFADLLDRFRFYQKWEIHDAVMLGSIFRDFERLVQEAAPAAVPGEAGATDFVQHSIAAYQAARTLDELKAANDAYFDARKALVMQHADEQRVREAHQVAIQRLKADEPVAA